MSMPVVTYQALGQAELKRTLQLFCIDLSGTVHVGDEMIPGAVDAVKLLRERKMKYKFVTNTTKESRSRLTARLAAKGLPIEDQDICSSLSATKDYVVQKNLKPLLLIDDDAMEEFKDIVVDEPDSVVVGLAPGKLNYEKLNEAFRVLLSSKRQEALVAVHKGHYYKEKDGLSLGPGPFVNALEYATGINSVVLGKPNQMFFNHVLNTCGVRPRTSIMIGDDVLGDIIGALEAGMNACLVKTGKYREGDENTRFLPFGEIEPVPVCERAFVAESLSEAVQLLT